MPSKRTAPLIIPIIGDPVAQVATPDLWNRNFKANNINAICVPIHLKSSGLSAFIDWVRHAENVPGFLSTIPHKSKLPERCDFRRNEVDVLEVANTVRKNKDGKLECAMFDGVGMISAIKATGTNFSVASVLIIGAGAAGSAIAYEALQCGAKSVFITDVIQGTASRVAARLRTIFPDRNIQTAETNKSHYEVIINASPIGSSPNDPMPCPLSIASSQAVIADAVTELEETKLLTGAKADGLKTVSGKDMAAAQVFHMQRFIGIGADG